ncbi:hypothetical protein IGI04_029992 [Brassica rapa subsp. trilocularis]|uniref:RNase H type-1 domain-containing protein n=1 Tax=Brassica rapa subsp. trilocularis TaxID=1813537 RepID=A0ABQ7LRR8_BRACM|nr:hypothetical protein IGI04_029992 [Brassica rapa subsp. trilocularis]
MDFYNSIQDTELKKAEGCFAYRNGSTAKGLWENMLQHSTCQSPRTDCKDLIAMLKDPYVRPSFTTELDAIKSLLICFPDFKISHIPRAQNISCKRRSYSGSEASFTN